MKNSSEKSLVASSDQVIYSDGCRVERRRRRREDRSGAAGRSDNTNEAEEIVLNQGDFETIEVKSAKKIKKPTIILSLLVVCSLALGSYALMQISGTSYSSLVEKSAPPLLDAGDDAKNKVLPIDRGINSLATSVNHIELEQVANLIIRERNWDEVYISTFIEKLQKLDKQSTAELSDTEWFQNVSFLVKDEIAKQELSISAFRDNEAAGESQNSLIKLAVAMGVSVPEYGPDPSQMEAASIEEILDEARVASLTEENEQVTVTEEPEITISETDINKVLDQYVAAYKAGHTEKILELYMFDGVSELDDIGKLKTHLEKMFKKSSKRYIDFNDLEWKIVGDKAVGSGKYKSNFVLKNGKGKETITSDTQIELQLIQGKLFVADLKLIAPKVKIVKPKVLSKKTKVTKRKKKTRKTTAKKSKKIPSKTKLAKKSTKSKNVSSKTKASSVKPNPQKVAVSANQKSSGKATARSSTGATAKNKTSNLPTKAELSVVIDKFVKAYNEGDIKTLGTLFAANAKTNDKNNLKEIQRDYIDLFSKTTDRQMHIKALNWTYKAGLAKGRGNLKVIVVTTMNSKAHVVNGTIQIGAKKQKGKVVITHLYHKEVPKLGMSALNN